jgi:hypothetical protein
MSFIGAANMEINATEEIPKITLEQLWREFKWDSKFADLSDEGVTKQFVDFFESDLGKELGMSSEELLDIMRDAIDSSAKFFDTMQLDDKLKYHEKNHMANTCIVAMKIIAVKMALWQRKQVGERKLSPQKMKKLLTTTAYVAANHEDNDRWVMGELDKPKADRVQRAKLNLAKSLLAFKLVDANVSLVDFNEGIRLDSFSKPIQEVVKNIIKGKKIRFLDETSSHESSVFEGVTEEDKAEIMELIGDGLMGGDFLQMWNKEYRAKKKVKLDDGNEIEVMAGLAVLAKEMERQDDEDLIVNPDENRLLVGTGWAKQNEKGDIVVDWEKVGVGSYFYYKIARPKIMAVIDAMRIFNEVEADNILKILNKFDAQTPPL